MIQNKTAAEELFRSATESTSTENDRLSEFRELLRDLYNTSTDPVELFRTLSHTRIRIQHGFPSDADRPARLHEIAIGYIDTELDLLARYGVHSQPSSTYFQWTGSLVELIEIIYALDEIGCINHGQNDIKDLAALFGSMFGMEIKVRNCYDAYLDMKRRKNDSRTYFLDKMRERLNLRIQRDDEKERMRR